MKASEIQILIQKISFEHDQSAFRSFFDHFYPSLKRFSTYFLKSPVYADEVVTDVFVKVWHKRDKLMTIRNIEAYLFTLTKRESLNYIRNHRLNANVFMQLNSEISLVLADPEREMISREIISVIESAINDLPEKCKLVFRLVKENGMKYREVAQLLDISEKSVEMHIGKAFKKIKLTLEKYENVQSSKDICKVILRLLPLLFFI